VVPAVAIESRERRTGDRRARYQLTYPERRSGFDRRTHRFPIVARYESMLMRYRANPRAILLVLAVFTALNFADLVLTYRALLDGAVEANPFMERLFDLHPVWAGIAKVSVGMVVAEVIWLFRRHRAALALSIYVTIGMGVLLLYHLSLGYEFL
jgi:Domain of unknown function (DUF5658)